MSQFQPVWSYPGPISSTDCTSTLINQFPVPPSTPMQPGQQFHHQQICMPAPAAPAYAAPAVISLGEEYTDETLPQAQTSYLSLEEDLCQEEEEGSDYYDDDNNNDDSSDEGDYSPISTNSPSPTAMHGQLGAIPALWHAEHARLKHIQAAVLDNEREARTRELKLESEVARIKDDLARLKEARAQSSSSNATGPFNLCVPPTTVPSSSSKPITSPNSAQAPPQLRACGPRGPRPRPQQQSQSSRTSSASSSTVEVSSAATTTSVQAPPTHSNSVPFNSSSPPSIPPSLLGKFSFEEDDDTTETVLSMNLTEARSARAQERQRRKKENERIRELSMLLTLGSEVRKWEERLAWQQARAMASTPSSDDMNLESSTKSATKAMDTDPDPRVKRLSRSSSLPSRGSYNPTAAPSPAASTSSTSNNGTTANNRSGPPSPALPSLAMSPLWRVSAEMILRRRSLSERPRRMPPKPLLPKATTPVPAPAPEQKAQVQPQPQPQQQQRKESSTSRSSVSTSPTKSGSGSLARPGHILRGPREQRSSGNSVSSNLASAPTVAVASTSAAATSSTVTGAVTASASSSSISTLSQNATGLSSGSSSPSSGKRYSIPPPITIPPNSQFCTSTTATASATGTGTGATTAATTTGAALRMAGQTPSANMTNGTTTFLLSKTTPVRPSALKWAFTADDLARERELEARTQEADLKADQLSDSASSSSEGESDDSRQSSSCDSSSSSGPEASQCVERRGRARFSWRKSLPKDSNNAQPVANT